MMNVFEKIREKLEEYHEHCVNAYGIVGGNSQAFATKQCIEIVNQVEKEHNNGWIPCSERLPEEYGEYLVWWTDITRSQYYEIVEYEPSNGWIGDIPQAVEGKYSVIAWQPLPEPYKESDTNGKN